MDLTINTCPIKMNRYRNDVIKSIIEKRQKKIIEIN